MRRSLLALILLLALSPPASACLNRYRKNINGDMVNSEGYGPSIGLRDLTSFPEHNAIKTSDLGPEPSLEADFEIRNDYAANLVHQGKTRKAIDILESVEKTHPGEYIVAANLGTAYELNGEVEKAMTWIAEGMKRNPHGHKGTEWLHLRILETKQHLAKDPNWLQSHSVLGFDFGGDVAPVMPGVWGEMGQSRTVEALGYQLHERLAFVAPPDPIVGDLLGLYADLVAVTQPAYYAVPYYDLALKFKPVHADLLEKRRGLADSIRPSWFEEISWEMKLGGVGAFLVVGLIALRFWRKTSPA